MKTEQMLEVVPGTLDLVNAALEDAERCVMNLKRVKARLQVITDHMKPQREFTFSPKLDNYLVNDE